MLVEQILDRKGSQVFAVRPNWPVRKAVAILAARNIGTALVTDVRGGLRGIVSERDLIRSFDQHGGGLQDLKVRDLMISSVITCTAETKITSALSLMAQHRIRHLPVVRDKKIVGLISIRDVLEFRLETLEDHFEALLHVEQESARARDAEQANRAKTEFLANMSHELRTPLNAVIGFSEIIAGELYGPDATTLYREYAGHINASGRHLLTLVNQVLDLSKIIAGKLELEESAVDLGGLLQECADLLAMPLAEKQLTLRSTIPAPLSSLTADALRLKQALLNLLSNAIKFSAVGSVVEARAELTSDGDLAIAIIDHGIGMRPEDIPIALEPYGQINSKVARTHDGTGLGLPLAKMLVEKHGGALTLTSALGQGTTVCIAMPGWRINYDISETLELA